MIADHSRRHVTASCANSRMLSSANDVSSRRLVEHRRTHLSLIEGNLRNSTVSERTRIISVKKSMQLHDCMQQALSDLPESAMLREKAANLESQLLHVQDAAAAATAAEERAQTTTEIHRHPSRDLASTFAASADALPVIKHHPTSVVEKSQKKCYSASSVATFTFDNVTVSATDIDSIAG